MSLHASLRTHSLVAPLGLACVGLVHVGCDSGGGTGESSNQSPSAALSLDARDGLTAAFSGAGSADADGEIASYEWSFGDGDTATGETVLHTYGADGTYTATLTVTDEKGATNSTDMDVMVSRTPTTFNISIENVGAARPFTKAGVFNTPVGADEPGPSRGATPASFRSRWAPTNFPARG